MKKIDDKAVNEFLSEVEEILESVADELIQLEQQSENGEADPDSVNAIFRGAHSIKGLSGMFGLTQITEVSHKLETLLDGLRMGKVKCEKPVVDLLFEGVDYIKNLCDKLNKGEDLSETNVEAFVARLINMAEGKTEAKEEGLDALDLPKDVLNLLTDYEVHRLEDTIKNPKKTLIRARVSLPMMTMDTDMEKIIAEIKGIGELISTLPSPGEIKDDAIDFDLIIGLKVPFEQGRQVMEPFGSDIVNLLKTRPAAQPQTIIKTPQAVDVSTPVVAAREITATPKREPKDDGEAAGRDSDMKSLSKNIRVELPKLDLLMNLVGELILTKGRLMSLSERLRQQMGFTGEALELTKAQKELERRLGALQEAVMDVRMVPLGQLFSKLNRAVRKILITSSKKVDLEILGAETQLDKLIVEDISDPLIHVIRNSVDHGIEDPEVRIAKGKKPEGHLRISAGQRGNYVVIEVADDGAGIDPERIRAKAIKTGLLREGEEVDKKRLFDMLFLPGFSTKEQVTELSGRGVGMDVLRKNIANLSGIIELESEIGKGTTIKIILPITLAIIQALLIEAADQTYAIPLNTVLETVVIEPNQINSLEKQPVLKLRDQTLPLVHVAKLFDLANYKEIPQFAVIVGIAEKRVAFGVDNLVSQRDVVIKSLGKRLKGLKGISGATDLGDQRTVLILDIAAMIDEVFKIS